MLTKQQMLDRIAEGRLNLSELGDIFDDMEEYILGDEESSFSSPSSFSSSSPSSSSPSSFSEQSEQSSQSESSQSGSSQSSFSSSRSSQSGTTGEDPYDGVEITDTHIITHHDRIPRIIWPGDIFVNATDGLLLDSPNAAVRIPEGVTKYVDRDVEVKGIEVFGNLVFVDGGRLLVDDGVQVFPTGRSQWNLPFHNETSEIMFKDSALNMTRDPEQFLKSFICVNGEVDLQGWEPLPVYATLSAECWAGNVTITVSEATNWNVGDEILIPDTRSAFSGTKGRWPSEYHGEIATISSVVGNLITLTAPLQYDHKAPRNPDGTLIVGLDGKVINGFAAHLSRNVRFTSENPAGVRGHVLLSRRSKVKWVGAGCYDMGRTTEEPIDSTTFNPDGSVAHIGTNQIARYAWHTHHLLGRKFEVYPFQWNVSHSAMVRSTRWGLAIHGSSWGRCQKNVVYHATGAGLVTEDGTEQYNVIEDNFVCRVQNDTLSTGERDMERSRRLGSAFWLHGMRNSFRRNIALNARVSGYTIFHEQHQEELMFALNRGDDPHENGEMLHPAMLAPIDWEDNFAGWCHIGMDPWTVLTTIPVNNQSFIYCTRGFHSGFVGGGWVFDNVLIRSDVSKLSPTNNYFTSTDLLRGFSLDDKAYSIEVEIKNGDIRGCGTGIHGIPPQPNGDTLTVRDTILECGVNIFGGMMSDHDATNRMVGVRLENVDYSSTLDQANKNHRDYGELEPVHFFAGEGKKSPRDAGWRIYITQGSDDYRLYLPEQKPDFVIPDASENFEGCPAGNGKTNTECWAESQVNMGMESLSYTDAEWAAAEAVADTMGIRGALFDA